MSPTTRASRRRRPAAVTIHDVAARAGVSVATVSRVLNRKTPVREETSRQVLEVARSLRYVPNVAARSLSIRRSHTIGIVLPEVHGDFFSEVIRGIDLAARRAGYHILVSGSHSDRNEMLEVLAAMRGRVDGLIVMSPDVALSALHDQLADQLPLVLLNSVAEGHTAITIDNYGGAHAMMRHLGTLGHSRIAFIKGPDRNADASERLRGYRHAMRQIGGRAADLEVPGEFSEESGYAAAGSILARHERPTAIFAANDAMAVGVLSAVAAQGLNVPADMAVVGFDDIPIARYLAPPLTTVKVDIAELGRRSFEAVIDRIDRGLPDQPRHECIPTSLVVRQSCGAATSLRRTKKASGKKKTTRQEEI